MPGPSFRDTRAQAQSPSANSQQGPQAQTRQQSSSNQRGGGSSYADWHRRQSQTSGGLPGGRNTRPAWSLRMEYWSPEARPTRIRVIPPMFEYWGRWVERQGKKRFVLSNSHGGLRPAPDLLYYYERQEGNEQLAPYKSDAVTVAVLENFHVLKVPSKKDPKKGYDRLVRCGGADRRGVPTCEHCRANPMPPLVFGNRQHWSLSSNMRAQLDDALAGLHNRCASCLRGAIQVYAYKCPECSEMLADHYNADLRPDEEQEATLKSEDVECQHCNKTVRAVEVIECLEDLGGGSVRPGCDAPQRGQVPADPLYGYDLQIAMREIGNNAKELVIVGFEPAQKYDIAANKLQPYNFLDFFGHMTLAEQSEILGRPNIFGPEGEEELATFMASLRADTREGHERVDDDARDGESIPW